MRAALALASATLIGASLTTGRHAFAETPTPRVEPYRLIFSSSTECRDAREFSEELHRRTNRLRPAAGHERAYTLLVDVAGAAGKARGQVVMRAPEGSLTVRDVEGTDCHEVLEGLALICAIALDAISPEPVVYSRGRASAASEWGFGLGARVTGMTGVLPGVAPGVSLYLEAWQEADSAFSPMLRLSAQRSRKTEDVPGSEARESNAVAAAEFQVQSVRLSLCPLHWAPARALHFHPCGFFEAGELRARGTHVVDDEPEVTLFWAGAGAELAVRAYPLGPLALGAEIGLVVPFRRDGFYFDPEGPGRPFHEVEPVGFVGGIGAGLRFF